MKTRRLKLLFTLFALALLLALPAQLHAAIGDKYEVKGAGSSEVNGVYTWVEDGKYTFDNSGTTYYLCNDNAASPWIWSITDDEMWCEWGEGYYTNSSSSLTPPETGWSPFMGFSPAPTVVPYIPGANITKTGTSAFRLVAPGEPVTYTLQFSNTYTDTITGVVITDTLPTSLTNVSVSSSGATVTPRGGTRYVWDVADLAAGQSGTITITGNISETVAEGTQIDNTA
jgi:uncharacterized repeat protein (TIGR01451 family)